jgi:hypothetical protein
MKKKRSGADASVSSLFLIFLEAAVIFLSIKIHE